MRKCKFAILTRGNLLLIGLPKSHYDKQVEKWKAWGFQSSLTAMGLRPATLAANVATRRPILRRELHAH
jgi:hypothetical protein